MKLKFLFFIPFLIMLIGCSPKDYQDNSDTTSQQLPAPKGEFESVTWFDENHLAFIYRPDELSANDMDQDFRIGIFEISTGFTKDVTVSPLTSECHSKRSGISNISRLPNGSLGFIFHCGSGEYTLCLLDPDSNRIVKLQTYLGFIAKSFSFSPDMSQLVQENGSGGGLSEKLLLVSSDKTIKELLPEFQRARSPAWSSDGKTIAFAGTKENPINTDTNTWQDIESLFLYPWDIFLMDADEHNPRILLPRVGTIYGLKWSPTNKNLLLFGGNSFDDVDGIWLLDIADMSIKRIWANNTDFDWSPDGSKVVLLENETGPWWSTVLIINIMKP